MGKKLFTTATRAVRAWCSYSPRVAEGRFKTPVWVIIFLTFFFCEIQAILVLKIRALTSKCLLEKKF